MNSTSVISGAPSIRRVAECAGVSPTTVSLVLNGRSGVAEDTRSTVLETVKELNYVPLPGGRPRKPRAPSPRTHCMALLAVGIPRAAMNAPGYMDLLHGIEGGARTSGNDFMLTHFPPGEPFHSLTVPRNVDGVVLFTVGEDEALILRLGKTPCVRAMGPPDPKSHWDHVTYDNRPVGPLAAGHLLARGQRHVAVLSSGDFPILKERYDTFGMAIVEAGGTCLELMDPELLHVEGTVERCRLEVMRALFDRLLAASPTPTALFCVADTLVQSCYSELQRRGLTPGKDIEIISCNNERLLLAHLHPRPATIDIHTEQIGRRAVEQLSWRIDHPGEPRVVTALEPTFVEGVGEVTSSEWGRLTITGDDNG